MYCYQCQETAKNSGCTIAGVCGKKPRTSDLMDVLMFGLKGMSIAGLQLIEKGQPVLQAGQFLSQAVFSTITNANFDDDRIWELINEAVRMRDEMLSQAGISDLSTFHSSVSWRPGSIEDSLAIAKDVGVLATDNEDIRSLRELLIYGVKGICAYADHAAVLGCFNDDIYPFIMKALAATTEDLSADELVALVMECGEKGVTVMALLDQANTESYGHPEITKVNIGVGQRPGIIISGHDLKDMEELLIQTEGQGVDVYTHGEMLPAHYYPKFKKYDHFFGNYGSSWFNQGKEFDAFNGPILMTTNCITPVKESYKNRFFTTGMAGYPGCTHIPDRSNGQSKDFSQIIALAKTCNPPTELETGEIIGGFARNQVMAVADKVIDAVKAGLIKRFVVMAGCDGRHHQREYFTEVAKALPEDTIILTAGCAKYRYNKLDLGDIGGIPRVLDAGQCNDSYSLAYIALQLKEAFGLDDINDLPISYDIAWYEQKAVIVLLALLYLGVKGIRLGPTLPAFLSPNIAAVLVEKFDIKPIGDVAADVQAITEGR